MLYFAYGSNMDWPQMRTRCPSARFVCIATLKAHRLAFTRHSENRRCGVADAVPAAGRDVWGIVYQLDERDIGKLDTYEGYQPGRPKKQNAYNREERHVYENDRQNRPLLVSIYFVAEKQPGHRPNSEYKRLLVDGAKFWHLPAAYIAELEKIETAE